jgi:hypothetical protein
MKYEDLLDDYVNDKLPELERLGFEQAMILDPALKQEVALQKAIINEIRQARIAELKAIMNNVPSGAWQNSATSNTIKIMVAAVAGSVLLLSAYFYFDKNHDKSQLIGPDEIEAVEMFTIDSQDAVAEADVTVTVTETAETTESKLADEKPAAKPKSSQAAAKNESPKINVLDFSEEAMQTAESKVPEVLNTETEAVLVSALIIETDESDSRYDFHYQFKDSKLLLYGKFDKSLYEVLEFNLDKKQHIYFYYKDNYYQLDSKQYKITSLEAITDLALIKKLNTHRQK